jgi:pSer/pThr/pTyr-binding forkhead associated (FHA) protein
VKLYGLTLQIEGVGLSPKHAQLKYDGFKSFNVIDFGSESGTWMNIAP